MLPNFSLPSKTKDVTWFDGSSKLAFLERQTNWDQTSFKTQNYDDSLSNRKPKQEHAQHLAYKIKYNLVNNQDYKVNARD
jgi:hypothetical protein